MKNIFALVFSLLIITTAAQAQRPRGTVRVRLSDGAPFTVVVNGRDYDRRASSMTIGDLPRGKHRIQVYALRGRKLQNPELVYTGRVRVDEGTVTYLTVDANRHAARIQTREPGQPDAWGDDAANPRFRSRTTDTDEDYTTDRSPRGGAPWFSDADLEDLRSRTAQRTTDADKLQLIRSVIAGKKYSTAQVRAMAAMVTFETTRLDLAKSAYEGVSDPKDYWKLEDIFTFDASKKELTEYMAQRR